MTGAALILAATFLTWLMVDTAQLFFLPALHLGQSTPSHLEAMACHALHLIRLAVLLGVEGRQFCVYMLKFEPA